MIRILLAQPGAVYRGAVAALLAAEDDLEVVADTGTQEEAAALVAEQKPDVVVLDSALPGPHPIAELCRLLCDTAPDLRVLALADRRATALLAPTVSTLAPRVGLLATEAPAAQLINDVRALADGRPVLDTDLAVLVLTAPTCPLTERERAVLREAVHGTPVKEIAANLHLSRGTVRNYLSRVKAKTGARTRIEAIRIAQEAGWI